MTGAAPPCSRAQRVPVRASSADHGRHRSDRAVARPRRLEAAAADDRRVGLLPGDVLGQLQVHGAGPFVLGAPERLTHPRRDVVGAGDLPRVLGQGSHHVHHVDDLELTLLAGLDGLLASNHQHGHGPELGVGRRGDQIGGARAQGGEADTGATGQASVGSCHETDRLLVTGQDQADLGPSQRIEQVEVLLAGGAEDVLDPLGFEGLDEQVRRLHGQYLRWSLCQS